MLAIYCWACGLSLSLICMHSETSFKKKNIFYFEGGCHLEIDCELRMAVFTHFPFQRWDPIWLRPAQGLCRFPQSLRVHMCITSVESRRPSFLGFFHFQWLLQCFFFLFLKVPQTMKSEIWWKHPILYRAFQSLSISAHFLVASLFTCSHRQQEGASLMVAEGDAVVWA